MASIYESREAERGSDVRSNVVAGTDDFATRLARIVLEWRPALPSTPPSRISELWMSRNVRRSSSTG